MPPNHLRTLITDTGSLEKQFAGQVFHAQDFEDTMFMLKTGYVKRYQITKEDKHVIELIYGPDHIFPLSQLYRKIFTIEQNQDHLVYVYQAITDIEIWRVANTEIESTLKEDDKLYIDLYYESGLRLKSNIDRLASNAILDDYKRLAHQLVCLADDFGSSESSNGTESFTINVPLTATDMAEQLNISVVASETILSDLKDRMLINITKNRITIPNLELLKDTYL